MLSHGEREFLAAYLATHKRTTKFSLRSSIVDLLRKLVCRSRIESNELTLWNLYHGALGHRSDTDANERASFPRILWSMIKALLCDIDGTLVQSNWLHARAWCDAFAQVGIELDVETVRRQIGKGGNELIPVFVPWWKQEHLQTPLKAYREHVFQQDYLPQVEPLPQAREFLLRLKGVGIRLALASSAGKADLLNYKKIVGMEDLVDEETSADDADRAKPCPDIFQATLRQLGLKPNEVLALGDTPYDAEAAGKAKVWTIGVESGGWNRTELLAAGCIEVYTDVAELLERFDASALNR